MREITKKAKRRPCKTCSRKLWYISQNGNCIKCAAEKVTLANLEMKHREGPIYERWKNQMIIKLGLTP